MWLIKNTMNAPYWYRFGYGLAKFLAMSNVSQTHNLWLTYIQDYTSEMFIDIPFIFAGSKILQLRKYFESPSGLL